MRTRKADFRHRLTVLVVLVGLLSAVLTSDSPLSLAAIEARRPSPPIDKVGAVATSQSKSSFPDRPLPAGANQVASNSKSHAGRAAPAQQCTFSVVPFSSSFSSSGGENAFDVITQFGCGWFASRSASWISIRGGNLVESGSLDSPISFGGPGDTVYIILFGTGIRFRSSLSAVSVTAGGSSAIVEFAAAQGTLVGQDQINAIIPQSLAGAGEINVVVTVDGVTSNTVKVTAGT